MAWSGQLTDDARQERHDRAVQNLASRLGGKVIPWDGKDRGDIQMPDGGCIEVTTLEIVWREPADARDGFVWGGKPTSHNEYGPRVAFFFFFALSGEWWWTPWEPSAWTNKQDSHGNWKRAIPVGLLQPISTYSTKEE
jgi:hypothetical protein